MVLGIVYKFPQTENVMDYGHLKGINAYSLWTWQWDMLLRNKTATAQRLIRIPATPASVAPTTPVIPTTNTINP